MNFYNEFDEFKCEWIQNLKGSGEIPEGTIDGRSITEVEAAELVGYHQAHFFTGIAGWPKALQLAGYGGTAGIWTGSPPCQPFSVAGKRKGEKDKRHLWPEFRRLIAQCRPSIVFIEQVASKDGREWFARVRSDFEDLGYRVGAADLCGACIGAPHIRQRLYIGAVRIRDTNVVRQDPVGGIQERSGADGAGGVRGVRMADSNLDGRTSSRTGEWETGSREPERRREPDRMAYTSDSNRGPGECESETGTRQDSERRIGSAGSGITDRLGNSQSDNERRSEFDEGSGSQISTGGSGSVDRLGHTAGERFGETRSSEDHRRESVLSSISGSWSDFRIIDCLDGKKRRVGTGIQPLAHGIPRGLGQSQSELRTMVHPARSNRKGRLKGYGDAIVVPLAAMFITEFFKALEAVSRMTEEH